MMTGNGNKNNDCKTTISNSRMMFSLEGRTDLM